MGASVTLLHDAYVWDWADLLFRWLHVIAGIVWIGTSFYFVALDNHLRPPLTGREREQGIAGDSWEIHGGGFYRVQKYATAPDPMPEPLHWFKWEAYTTWLSGFALMVVLYYIDAETYLVDPSVRDISTEAAIGISIGGIALAWFVYEALCRIFSRSDLLLAAALGGVVAVAAWGASEVFSARAVPIQIGSMLGTIMVANVFFVIIPGHWELVRARRAGREPDPSHGIRGKRRSVHNNYLTLPVVLAMLGPHFPFAFVRDNGWVVLLVLMLVGVWIRLFFNLRHRGQNVIAIPVTAAIALLVVGWVIRPDDGETATPPAATTETTETQTTPTTTAAPETVAFARVAEIIEQRCTPCHSMNPTQQGFSAPPGGIAFDTPEEIRDRAAAIEEQAVSSNAMPLGNVTNMTDGERELVGRWIEQGAQLEP
jgi:uncharacterized membrane protein